jgi:hypothetical protein
MFGQTPERLAHIADQQAAAVLDGRIASRWGTTEDGGTWIAGAGWRVPSLLGKHHELLEEHRDDTCPHLTAGDFESDAVFWPTVAHRVVCDDVCLSGPAGLLPGLLRAIDSGLWVLRCDQCGEPIAGDFLHLVDASSGVFVQGTFCRSCIEGAAPRELLP